MELRFNNKWKLNTVRVALARNDVILLYILLVRCSVIIVRYTVTWQTCSNVLCRSVVAMSCAEVVTDYCGVIILAQYICSVSWCSNVPI